MCKCEMKEKLPTGNPQYHNYVFLCKKGDKTKVVTIENESNDIQARHLAELKCAEQDENKKVMSQSKTICEEPVPSGWIVTNWGNKCKVIGNKTIYRRTITKIAELAPGTELTICSNNSVPSGWIAVNWGFKCKKVGTSEFYRRRIKKIRGMAKGAVVSFCSQANIPEGWELISKGNECKRIGNKIFIRRKIRKK